VHGGLVDEDHPPAICVGDLFLPNVAVLSTLSMPVLGFAKQTILLVVRILHRSLRLLS
jgi:hypothetical protein